ncbi:helix-turn-helix domain-containing protein [Corynebacterium striatum]|uniref:helix-turn-helix domain-containing protein n=1 Tax=Corynebacterium striatum TaxID=43770 RepID=UPI003F7CD3F6
MPARQPIPKELYPEWPDAQIKNLAHARLQLAARNIRRHVRDNIELKSLKDLAEVTGVGNSTISDFVAGRAWPSVLTIAQIEVGSDREIWPRGLGEGRRIKPTEIAKFGHKKDRSRFSRGY